MNFQIGGKRYDITREQIMEATRGAVPIDFTDDGRYKYYVQLHGRSFPIKQPIRLVTGIPNIKFTAGHAERILTALSFDVEELPISSVESEIATKLAGRDTIKLPVVLESDEDGYVVASCPTLPGCHSQGRTREEAISNIREAIRGYVASMRKHGEPLPTSVDVAEVEVPM